MSIKLMYSESLTSTNELNKKTLNDIHHWIKTGNQNLKDKIRKLRIIKTIDEEKYQKTKKHLPYYTSSIFHPRYRNKENFAAAYGMTIDLDKIFNADLFEELKYNITKDKQVSMAFTSPSGNGLKLFFHFEEPLYDIALYETIYKKFSWLWAKTNQCEEYIDLTTFDVTRATFLSYDPKVYYNDDALPIEMNQTLGIKLPEQLLQSKTKTNTEIKQVYKEKNTHEQNRNVDNAIEEIRIRLNIKERKSAREKNDVFVPPEVDSVIGVIHAKLNEADIELLETKAINYGRTIKAAIDGAWCSINIFFGRKGYSLVISPQKGSNKELGLLVKDIISEVL